MYISGDNSPIFALIYSILDDDCPCPCYYIQIEPMSVSVRTESGLVRQAKPFR